MGKTHKNQKEKAGRSWLEWLLINALIAGLYFFAGRFGVSLAIPPGLATPVWFPSGVALLAVLAVGYRACFGIWLGSCLVNGFALWESGGGLEPAALFVIVAIASGSTLQSALGAYLIDRQFSLLEVWDRVVNIFRFIFTVAPLCGIGASIGVLAMSAVGMIGPEAWRESWITWWLGDFVGILVVLPFSVFLPKSWGASWEWRRTAEFFLFLALLTVACLAIFGNEFHIGAKRLPLDFGVIPFLIWGAFRFGQKGSVLSVTIISLIALMGTIAGFGPFSNLPRNDALLMVQSFVGVLSLTGLVLAGALKEHTAAEEGLKRAVVETQRISQLKSEFASIVSHELRTPLTVIKDSIAMVLDGVDGPVTSDQHDSLGRAMSNVDRLVRLISNVLDFEKLESGRMAMSFASVDLKAALQEVIQFMQVPAGKKQAELLVEFPEAAIQAICDEDKIKEVLLNLLDNSLKFTPSGGRIWIRLKSREEGMFLEVEDEGVGIPEEEQERIFEIFRRASTPSIVKAGGFGIGLAVCKMIVDLHQGSIAVHSTPGKGTCFRLFLPRNPRVGPPVQIWGSLKEEEERG